MRDERLRFADDRLALLLSDGHDHHAVGSDAVHEHERAAHAADIRTGRELVNACRDYISGDTTQDANAARAPQSVTATLEDEIDLSRGEMLVDAGAEAPFRSNAFRATLVWMSEQPLVAGQSYLLKHTTRVVRAKIRSILHRVDVVTADPHPALTLQMNDIAELEFDTSLPLFFDNYEDSRPLGSFILIDPISNGPPGGGNMPAYGQQVNSDEMAALVDFLVSLRPRGQPPARTDGDRATEE